MRFTVQHSILQNPKRCSTRK